MTSTEIYEYCMSKKGAEETFPFDKSTLVFKVGGKMFGAVNVDEFQSINLKCDPEKSIELREEFEDIRPGYHMNKKHWNTVNLQQSSLKDVLIKALIDHSYDLVYSKLPKKIKAEIDAL